MLCSQCGAQLMENAKFCGTCGSPVKKENETNSSAGTMPTAPQDDAAQWYFHDDTEKRGPYSYEQMIGFINNGKIQRETLVWVQGSPAWVPAERSRLAKELGNVMPPTPIGTISEKWIWALAAGPIVLNVVLTFVMADMRLLPEYAWVITVGTIAANIIFLIQDTEEVKKSGRDVGKWLFLGIVLVPIYLYVREKHTNKNYAPLIVWCVLFFISLI